MGMRGSAVNGLQERLKAIGAFKGAIDGVFGAETQEAVKTAQRNFSLEPDGIVGPETWMALLRE
jgi:peptidoglycan hydrolase-like protein with peptidoglycan-binding domain